MIKLKLILTLILLAVCQQSIFAEESVDELLNRLDATIAEKAKYAQIKERKINDYKRLAATTTDIRQRYGYYGRLFDEYRSYRTDSAMRYASLKMAIAKKLGDSDLLCDSRLNYADIYSLTGMFKEAVDMLNTVNRKSVPQYLIPYYYHLHKNTYGLMGDYAVNEPVKQLYNRLSAQYRDSLLALKTDEYIVIMAEKLVVEKRYDEAIKMINSVMSKLKESDHNRAFFTYSLAQIYKGKGNVEEEERNLALSSINDLQSAVKEYVSLRQLANLLYHEGDVDHAYKYLRCSMEDAKECNARMRTIEIGDIFPIVDNAYNQKKEEQKRNIVIGLFAISVLSIFLIITIFFVFRQMRKLSVARQNLHSANDELSALNATLVDVNKELNTSNERLKQTNDILTETNVIKEEYIGRYMDQCSTYIEKFETYRKMLFKIVASHNMTKLAEAVKSTALIDHELKDFYSNFDETFLRLFPNFVDDFNKLLCDGEKIYPKTPDALNTELRIYALIRLGITDSVKIAQFLRYSVTTIYNYRTRIRNKAIGEREEFEDKVMKIGF